MDAGFLGIPEPSADVQRLYDEDVEDVGFVMNVSRLWAHHPAAHDALFELIGQAARSGGLTFRQRGVLIAAGSAAMGDSYCALAWGQRLAAAADPEIAADVLHGVDDRLDDTERALARWARQVAGDPSGTGAADVQPLRDAGYDDTQIFAITLFVALRIAFSSVNDALGSQPDHELGETVPAAVRDAVTFGRPIGRGDG